jgi:hypothetical protein
VTVVNNSGEDYEGAQVRLVVGTINLVEKIQQLAQAHGLQNADDYAYADGKKQEFAKAIRDSEALDLRGGRGGGGGGSLGKLREAPQIIKEGLSEYFIFTVEGQQTVKNGWSQRMISFQAKDAPVRFFILANDKDHKMGESPLPDGAIRVFRENGQGGLSFYVTQSTKYIPIKEKIELNVGKDDQIVYERVVKDVARDNFIYDETSRPKPTVVGWDEMRQWREEVRNYRAKPIKLEIRHVLQGDVAFSMKTPGLKLYDFHTAEYTLEVAPGKKTYDSEGTFHLGRNTKQNEVRLASP